MSAATINTKVTEAVTAIESGDWETAYTKLMAAKALVSTRPRNKKGDAELEYDGNAIDSLITRVNKERHGAEGIQRIKIKYVTPTD